MRSATAMSCAGITRPGNKHMTVQSSLVSRTATCERSEIRPNVFGIDFDPLDQSSLIAELLKRAREGRPSYVLTTSLHHVLLLRRNAELRRVFADPAALVVPDGRPLLWMGWLRGITMQLVTGSDLVVPLCRAAAQQGLSV